MCPGVSPGLVLKYFFNMRPLTIASLVIHGFRAAQATKHYIFTGTYGTPFIYTVEFNDENSTLKLVANTSVPVASQWLALSVRLKIVVAELQWTDKISY
jgi:hypothetical protein